MKNYIPTFRICPLDLLRFARQSATVFAAILFTGMLAVRANAATLTVPSGTYPTIQSAVDAAADGDTIDIGSGTYLETINLGGTNAAKNVTIQGTGATVDAGGFGVACLTADGQGSTTQISGITFQNGNGLLAGGIELNNCSMVFSNCTFFQNQGLLAGCGYSSGGSPTFDNCTFTGNFSNGGGGGGIYSFGNLTLTKCSFNSNSCPADGGGLFNSSGTVSLSECEFYGNISGTNGGAVLVTGGALDMVSCSFAGNSAPGGGGAVETETGTTVSAVNCWFSGNGATNGGGMNIAGGSASIVNCSFTANTATAGGAIFSTGTAPLTIANSILYGDTGGEIGSIGSTINASFSNIQGGTGSNMVSGDPMFVDPDGADNTVGTDDDDLHLQNGSVCVDAGSDALVPFGITTDYDGNARFVGTVDMGAFESNFPPPPPPDPEQQIRDLRDDITELVASGAHLPGDGRVLKATLNVSLILLSNGHPQLASLALSVFKLQVNLYVAAHRLTPAQAQPLIDAANVIIAELVP